MASENNKRTQTSCLSNAIMGNPNFPPNLDIKPSSSSDDTQTTFGTCAQVDSIRTYGIAGRVWEAAYVMQAYISNDDQYIFEPTFLGSDNWTDNLRILELGSGTGIIAAEFARLLSGQNGVVIATDLPEVCPLLKQNLQSHCANTPTSLTSSTWIQPLAWGNADHARHLYDKLSSLSHDIHLTHIICSDLVYFPELLGPLLRCLIHLTTPPFTNGDHPELRPKVIISYKVRSLLKEAPFWSAFGLWFHFEPVLYRPKPSTLREASDLINITGTCLSTDRSQGTREDHDEGDEWRIYGASGDNESPIFVFVGHRRPESVFWWVPDSDESLLAGAGAHGTDTTKSDDTFESILFLNLLVED